MFPGEKIQMRKFKHLLTSEEVRMLEDKFLKQDLGEIEEIIHRISIWDHGV